MYWYKSHIYKLPSQSDIWLVSINLQHVNTLIFSSHTAKIMIFLTHVNPSNAEATSVQSTKTLKPCHVGIHWIALIEYSQMSTRVPMCQGCSHFTVFLHHCVMPKLATSSIKLRTKTKLDKRLSCCYSMKH